MLSHQPVWMRRNKHPSSLFCCESDGCEFISCEITLTRVIFRRIHFTKFDLGYIFQNTLYWHGDFFISHFVIGFDYIHLYNAFSCRSSGGQIIVHANEMATALSASFMHIGFLSPFGGTCVADASLQSSKSSYLLCRFR